MSNAHRTPGRTLFTFLILSGLLGAAALGDVVTLVNGDRLTGSVITKDGPVLRFRTSYAGTLEIQWAEVRDLRMDSPSTVLLNDETPVTTRTIPGPGVAPSSKSPGIRVVPEDVTAINPKPASGGDRGKFSGQASLSLELEGGNSASDELDADLQLNYRRGRHRFDFKGQLEYEENDGRTTQRDWLTLANYASYVTERDYWSFYQGLEQKRFDGLRLRQVDGAAVGRDLYTGSPTRLSSELGLFAIHEDFSDLPDGSFPAAGWLLDFEHDLIPDRLQFYHRHYSFLNVEDPGKQIWHSWTGLRSPLFGGLTGSTEFELDYDSEPALEAKSTDTTPRFKVGYAW